MWSDFDIYFQNLEEDEACVQALECFEVFGTQPPSQLGLDHVLGSLCAQDQGFGLPVDDPVDESDDGVLGSCARKIKVHLWIGVMMKIVNVPSISWIFNNVW